MANMKLVFLLFVFLGFRWPLECNVNWDVFCQQAGKLRRVLLAPESSVIADTRLDRISSCIGIC
jgi:hypothetical protein